MSFDDSVRQKRRPWPTSMKTAPLKQAVGSSETVFCRLRSNAFSMTQKLSRAKQNISIKIADIEKQKEANEAMRNHINDVGASIAILNAEISQRQQSLEDFKKNSDAFHKLFGSAGVIFQKNDSRLASVERSLRRLEIYLSKAQGSLQCFCNQEEELKAKLATEHMSLEFSKTSLCNLVTMIREVESFSATVCTDIEGLDFALNLFAENSELLLRERTTVENDICNGCEMQGISVYLGQRLSILACDKATLDRELEHLKLRHHDLIDCYGDTTDFERSCAVKRNLLNEMQLKIESAHLIAEKNRNFLSEHVESNRLVKARSKQVNALFQLLTCSVDQKIHELESMDTETEQCLELNHLSKNLESYKETRCSFIWKKAKELDNSISDLLVSIDSVSGSLSKISLQRERIMPYVCTNDNLQLQLTCELAETIALIEEYDATRRSEFENLMLQISRLCETIWMATQKEELVSRSCHYAKAVSAIETHVNASRKKTLLFHQQKQRLLNLCERLACRNRNLIKLIDECEQNCCALSEEIELQDAAARQQQLLNQAETTRARDSFEKSLSQVKTQRAIDQFEQELHRANKSQELELKRKNEELESLIEKKKREKKAPEKINQFTELSKRDNDSAIPQLNGGRECPPPTSEYNFELENVSRVKPVKVKVTTTVAAKDKDRKDGHQPSEKYKRAPNSVKKRIPIGIGPNKKAPGTRHRRQAAHAHHDGNKSSSYTNSPDIDPFAFV